MSIVGKTESDKSLTQSVIGRVGPHLTSVYTVGHKKRGSKLVSITLANLNRF